MAVVQEESWFPEFGRAAHVIAPGSSASYAEHEDEPGTHLMDACHVKQRRQRGTIKNSNQQRRVGGKEIHERLVARSANSPPPSTDV